MFAEFPPEQFPLIITMFRDKKVAWQAVVTDAGALSIPALGDITRCVIIAADGHTYDTADPEG
jgi:hypothetical protein